MPSSIHLNISQLQAAKSSLKVRDRVLLSGTVYTARDAAHKRLCAMCDENSTLPLEICGSVLYYAGPTPTPKNGIIGSCGPTTSGRMDIYTPQLLDLGLLAMIGKGKRSDDVIAAIVRNKSVYFCATGGAGALYGQCIKAVEVIAFEDLGCESIKRLTIENFPVYVGIDSTGASIYDF